MLGRKGIIRLLLVGGVGLSLALSACSKGVPQSEVDALRQQLNAKEQEVASVKQQLTAATSSGQQATALQEQLAAKEKELADFKKLSVWSAIPNATPRPTATPLPPGVTPAPTPTPPAAKVVPLAFYVDTVTSGGGESKYNVNASLSCMRTGVFKRGQAITFRMEVTDTSSGKVLQAADVDTAVLKLPNGENLNFRYGRHGATATAPWFWAVRWDIPADYPLGYINYTIDVTTKSGKSGTFKEMVLESATLPGTTSGLMVIE